MADYHCHSPVIGNRLIQIVIPYDTIQLRLALGRAQGLFE